MYKKYTSKYKKYALKYKKSASRHKNYTSRHKKTTLRGKLFLFYRFRNSKFALCSSRCRVFNRHFAFLCLVDE